MDFCVREPLAPMRIKIRLAIPRTDASLMPFVLTVMSPLFGGTAPPVGAALRSLGGSDITYTKCRPFENILP